MGTGGTPMGGAGGAGGAPVLCNSLSPEAVATIDAAWQHDEPVNELQLARWSDSAPGPELLHVEPASDVRDVRVMADAEGGWLAWRSGESWRARRLTPQLSATGPLHGFSVSNFGVAGATPLGRRLALAAAADVDRIRVALRETDGSLVTELTWLVPDNAGPEPDPPALLGSPDGQALIVAWVSRTSGERALWLARLRCE